MPYTPNARGFNSLGQFVGNAAQLEAVQPGSSRITPYAGTPQNPLWGAQAEALNPGAFAQHQQNAAYMQSGDNHRVLRSPADPNVYTGTSLTGEEWNRISGAQNQPAVPGIQSRAAIRQAEQARNAPTKNYDPYQPPVPEWGPADVQRLQFQEQTGLQPWQTAGMTGGDVLPWSPPALQGPSGITPTNTPQMLGQPDQNWSPQAQTQANSQTWQPPRNQYASGQAPISTGNMPTPQPAMQPGPSQPGPSAPGGFNMDWLTSPAQTFRQSNGSMQRTSQTFRNGQAGPMQTSFQQFGSPMTQMSAPTQPVQQPVQPAGQTTGNMPAQQSAMNLPQSPPPNPSAGYNQSYLATQGKRSAPYAPTKGVIRGGLYANPRTVPNKAGRDPAQVQAWYAAAKQPNASWLLNPQGRAI